MTSDNHIDEGTSTPNERFHKALEALQSKPPAVDKKTAFWNAYKTLADEHDREFQQKYSTDLDTALIFARGTPLVVLVAQNLLYVSLFSTLLAALLAVLGKQWLMYYMAAGERGTIEARGLERQRKFDGLRKWKFDTVMQLFPLLLQIGLFLFSAALSIYLWNIHLSLALIVLSLTSIGVVSYTTLLMSAVAFPDSPFQTPLAALVARLWKKIQMFFGSAMTFMVRQIPRTLQVKAKMFMVRSRTLFRHAHARITQHIGQTHQLLPSFKNNKLPEKTSPEATEMTITPSLLAPLLEGPFPRPSPEVPAVSWVLETSTDPRTVAAAAEMVIDLQWSGGLDVGSQLSKLGDGIISCCDITSDGLGVIWSTQSIDAQAIHLGRAYCTLRCVPMSADSNPHKWQEYWCLRLLSRSDDKDLEGVLQLLTGSSDLSSVLSQHAKTTKWALNVISAQCWAVQYNIAKFLGDIALIKPIPSLDRSMLADYLFAVGAFLSPINPRINRGIIWRDKSPFVGQLFEHLLHALVLNIQTHQISMDTVAHIMNVTSQIILCSDFWLFGMPYQFSICQFCSSLPRQEEEGWIDVVLATVSLLKPTEWFTANYTFDSDTRSQDATWVHKALDCIVASARDEGDWDNQVMNGVAGLLNALFYYRAPVDKKHIHTVLRALKLPGHVSAENAAYLLVHDDQFAWFQDEQLQPTLQDASVWPSIMHTAVRRNRFDLTKSCLHLGCKLVQMTYWKPQVLAELCSWIPVFFDTGGRVQADTLAPVFNSVLGEGCQTGYSFCDDREQALGLSYEVLCNVWGDFKLNTPEQLETFIPWLRCTALLAKETYGGVVWAEGFPTYLPVTSRFETTFCVPLRDTLLRGAKTARDTLTKCSQADSPDISQEWNKVLQSVPDILEDIANQTPTDANPEEDGSMVSLPTEWAEQIAKEIDTLETGLKALSAAGLPGDTDTVA
ncbi:hypothetical protein DFH06DRAFT_1369638 [Mycena polygramma]|nr:hypothetical protein DFH06DRAFT_1369638 [Mycena polygramma]